MTVDEENIDSKGLHPTILMAKFISNSLLAIKKIIDDPLYKNSFFILLNAFVSAIFGLLYWVLAARFYSSADVGIATALISVSTIIGSISGFGLGAGVVRFLPESDEKSLLFNSIWIFSLISSLIFGIIFLLGIGFFTPALKFLMTPWFAIIFLLFLIFQTNNGLGNASLLALRKAEYSFAQSIGLGSRLLLLIPLEFGGVMGIFGSLGIAYAISSLIGIFILYKLGISIKLTFRKKLIKDISNFSLASYAIDTFLMVQSSILPVMVLNVIGAKEAAHFYVAFSIASLLYAIPASVFMSMFIEGSHGEPLRKNLIKSLAIVSALMIPAVVVLYFFGDIILSLFSKEYSQNAYEILKLSLIHI